MTAAAPRAVPDEPRTTSDAWERAVIPLLYLLSLAVIVVRLAIVTVSTQACDDHMVPVDFILSSGRLPRYADCFQCYHPKLFYVVEADLIRAFGIENRVSQIQLGALLNWTASVVVALLVVLFLRWQRAPRFARAVAFSATIAASGVAIVAVQPSNDAWVAGFSAIAVVALYRWLGARRPLALALALTAAALAASTKGSGLVVFAGVLASLLFQGLRFWRAHKGQLAIAIVLTALGVGLAMLSGYYVNYKDAGSPFAANIPRAPPAPFFTQSRRADAGFNSFADAFFDFPILSELRVPYVGYADSTDAPAHRTNFWTMLHGAHVSSRFSQWPDSWMSTDALTVSVARLEMLFGLVPLGLLVLGVLRRLRDHVRLAVDHGLARLAGDRDVWVTSLVLVLVGMVGTLSSTYRWASSMKTSYLYPGLLGFAACLAAGVSVLARPRLRHVRHAVLGAAAALVTLSLLDNTLLAADLFRSFQGRATHLASIQNELADGDQDVAAAFAKARVVSGKARSGLHVNGDPVFCDRSVHDHVIAASSRSEVDVPLDGTRSRFRVTVCNSPKTRRVGTGVRFKIFADEKLLWDSGVVMAGAWRDADVLVGGATTLRLVVVNLDGWGEDAPAWIDPRLR